MTNKKKKLLDRMRSAADYEHYMAVEAYFVGEHELFANQVDFAETVDDMLDTIIEEAFDNLEIGRGRLDFDIDVTLKHKELRMFTASVDLTGSFSMTPDNDSDTAKEMRRQIDMAFYITRTLFYALAEVYEIAIQLDFTVTLPFDTSCYGLPEGAVPIYTSSAGEEYYYSTLPYIRVTTFNSPYVDDKDRTECQKAIKQAFKNSFIEKYSDGCTSSVLNALPGKDKFACDLVMRAVQYIFREVYDDYLLTLKYKIHDDPSEVGYVVVVDPPEIRLYNCQSLLEQLNELTTRPMLMMMANSEVAREFMEEAYENTPVTDTYSSEDDTVPLDSNIYTEFDCFE